MVLFLFDRNHVAKATALGAGGQLDIVRQIFLDKKIEDMLIQKKGYPYGVYMTF